jgi:hypothetical protein
MDTNTINLKHKKLATDYRGSTDFELASPNGDKQKEPTRPKGWLFSCKFVAKRLKDYIRGDQGSLSKNEQ